MRSRNPFKGHLLPKESYMVGQMDQKLGLGRKCEWVHVCVTWRLLCSAAFGHDLFSWSLQVSRRCRCGCRHVPVVRPLDSTTYSLSTPWLCVSSCARYLLTQVNFMSAPSRSHGFFTLMLKGVRLALRVMVLKQAAPYALRPYRQLPSYCPGLACYSPSILVDKLPLPANQSLKRQTSPASGNPSGSGCPPAGAA